MRLTLFSFVLLSFAASELNADIIDANVIATGAESVHFSFTLNGFDLLQNEIIDIQFDPAVYASLEDAIVPANFKAVTLQPNNPPGAPGDFLVEALASNPAWAQGAVGIDATLIGQRTIGTLSLSFSIDQFNDQGAFEKVVMSGTVNLDPKLELVPEPAGVARPALALLIILILASHWRHREKIRAEVVKEHIPSRLGSSLY